MTYVDEANCVEPFTVESMVTAMLYHEGKDEVVVLTKNVVLFRWQFVEDSWRQARSMLGPRDA